MGSYYFPDRAFDHNIWLVALYPSLFFIGTTLYVKSVMRERKNPLYLKLSIGFHVVCILGFLLLQQYLMAFAFVPPLIRAIWLPHKKIIGKTSWVHRNGHFPLVFRQFAICYFMKMMKKQLRKFCNN